MSAVTFKLGFLGGREKNYPCPMSIFVLVDNELFLIPPPSALSDSDHNYNVHKMCNVQRFYCIVSCRT